MKKRKLDKSIILIFLIFILIIAMGVSAYIYFRPDILTETLKKGIPLKILFIFSDNNDVLFMELFFYHPEQKKGSIFFIPANLGSKIESLDKMDKISVLYKPGKISPLKKKVEQIVGFDIPFYIDLKVENISRLIDLLEGIEIFISNPVDKLYKDRRILIPSGNVILDGDKIVDYILFEDKDEEERDKVFIKQKFLQSLLKRIGDANSNKFLLKEKPFNYFCNIVDTNISKRDLISFIRELVHFDTDHIYLARVEGKTFLIEGKELIFPHFKGEYLKLNIKQILDTISSNEIFDNEVLTVTLEILNGTTIDGLASRTANLFQSYGYDVINIANADHHSYNTTLVLDRKGRLDLAEKVAEIIQCDKVRTEISNLNQESPDVTLILGKDFDGTTCKK